VALLPEDRGSEVRGGIGRKAFEAFLPMKLLTSARGLMGSARLRLAARFAAFGRSACVGRTFVRGFEAALRTGWVVRVVGGALHGVEEGADDVDVEAVPVSPGARLVGSREADAGGGGLVDAGGALAQG